MSAPAQTGAAPQHDEVQEWIGRFSHAASNSKEYTKPAHPEARPWTTSFFGCFDPIDTCLITCCCPCVTFGKTHHRLRVDSSMKGYSPVNASCIGWWLGAYCCLGPIFQMLQRHDMNEKYGLKSDFAPDCLKAVCCGCCDLIQQEKESEYQLLNNGGPLAQQPGLVKQEMVATPQGQAPPMATQ